jgi:hypothetical protein
VDKFLVQSSATLYYHCCKLVKVTFCCSFSPTTCFDSIKNVVFRLSFNLRLISNACHIFYSVPSEISSGLQICLLKLIKVNFLTECNACGRDASVIA